MSIEELRKNLRYLATRYANGSAAIMQEIDKTPVPVKGILADMQPSLVSCSASDGELIKEIVYFYA